MTEEIILTQQEYNDLISVCTTNREKYSKLAKKYKELTNQLQQLKELQIENEKLREELQQLKELQIENEKLRKQSEEITCLYAELDKARNRIKELENSPQSITGGNTSANITIPAKKTAVKEMFSYL